MAARRSSSRIADNSSNNTAVDSTTPASQKRVSHQHFSYVHPGIPRPKSSGPRRSSRRTTWRDEEEMADGPDERDEEEEEQEEQERPVKVKVERGVKDDFDDKNGVKQEDGGQELEEQKTPAKRGSNGRRASIKQENAAELGSQGSRKRGRGVKAENGTEESGEADTSQTASAEKEAGDGEEDGDGDWEGVKDTVDAQLTYEQQRQANIRRNLQQMQMLQLSSILPASHSSSSSSSGVKRKKVTSAPQRGRTIPTRRSLRNQGLDPEGNEAEIKEGEGRYVPELSQWVRPTRREGSISMSEIKLEVSGSYNVKEVKEEIEIDGDEDEGEKKEAVKKEASNVHFTKAPRDATIDGLCATFKALAPSSNPKRKPAAKNAIKPLTGAAVGRLHPLGMTNKLVRKRCTTMAFHPSSNAHRSILVAGDKTGEMGVLCYGEVERMREEGGGAVQCAFSVHDGGINSFCFNDRFEYCYSASNDGTIRQLSFDYQQFLESYVNEDEMSFQTVTSNSHHPNSLFACDRKGDLVILDTSSSSLSVSSRTSLSHLKVNCVSVHSGGHLLASCGNDRTVRLWDLRQLRDDTPLHTFEHGYSVNSVYFSPSGDHLLSTCIDDYVRVWTVTGEDVGEWPDCTRIRHNNQTGRWVTLFKAKWTMTDDAFLIGNMSRQVDLFAWDGAAEGGKKDASVGAWELHAQTSSELTAIPSAVAIHPSNEYFVGATASSYAYLWGV